MLKKQKQIEINSDSLYQISVRLLDHYEIEANIYYMVLLSYLTVKDFSRTNEHLDKNAKIELCIQYTPDMIMGLSQSKILNSATAEKLKKEFIDNEQEMKLLLDVYHAIFNFKTDKIPKNKCCIL